MKLNNHALSTLLELVAEGHTLGDACKKINVSYNAVYRKARLDDKFREALAQARSQGKPSFKASTIDRSRESFLRRLRGYEVTETTQTFDGEGKLLTTTTTTRHVPADPRLLLRCAKYIFNEDETPPQDLPCIVFNCAPRPDTSFSETQNPN